MKKKTTLKTRNLANSTELTKIINDQFPTDVNTSDEMTNQACV